MANINNPYWVYLQHDLFYYFVNCKANKPFGGTTMATYGTFKDPQSLKRFAKRRYNYDPKRHKEVYPNGGWHYSYLTGGDPDKIRYKVENIFESESIIDKMGSREDILKKVANHQDLFGRTQWKLKQSIVDISKTKPKSMDEFLKKYPQFFLKES